MAAYRPLRIGVQYDFRVPPDAGFDLPALYADVLDQVRFLDGIGFDLVWLSEHHFVSDGYLPSFQPVAGALAAVTRRMRISSDVILAPFHHPVRLAEDLAVLDNLSGGRMELGVGMGYAVHEFEAFGLDRRNRVSLTEETVEILRQAWSSKLVQFEGRRYRLRDVDVYPKPVQPGGIPLWMAAQSEPGVRRAARMGAHLLPQGPRRLLDIWREAVAEAGDDVRLRRVGINRSWLITDDRATDWPRLKAGEVYRAKIYQRWNDEAGENPEAWSAPDRIPQTWVIGDEEHVLRELTQFCLEYGITDLVTWAAPPGVLPTELNESLRRFAAGVAPRLRAAVDAARSGA
jgi:alkanesulfonate monooxygenase SsuD/methylene tetrahydromethanopterin reductase-like flavin-dependent oxidoreductase (luciferase family)